MNSKISLLVLCFTVTFLTAQTPDSTGLRYAVDTIAAPNCYQSADGAILLDSVSIPGTIDRYEWSDGSDEEDLIFINGGEYQLTVFNTEGASFKSEIFFVPEPDTLVINRFASPPTAPNLKNGFFDLTISGGTQPFLLQIIHSSDTSTVSTDSIYTLANVDTGLYVFTVLDARGCTDTMTFDMPAIPCRMLATALTEPAECPSNPTGRIELLIDNAVEPVSIDWDIGTDNRRVQNNLTAGVYGFRIVDRRGCNVSDSIEIIYDDKIPPEAVIRNNVLLYLDDKGAAKLETRRILLGARDECSDELNFELEQNQFTCSDLGINEVDFYISDEAGNTLTAPVQVEVRDTHSIQIVYEDTVYTALCNGIAQYPPPRLQGSCSQTSTSGLIKATEREITAPGTYEDEYYFVKKRGDTLKANVTVIVADTRVRAFLIVEETQCGNGDDGSVVVALRNSKTPVTYQWNNGSDKDFIFGLVNQKEYQVTVTEGNGCIFNLSAFIEGPDSLSVDLQEIIEKAETIDIIPKIQGGHQPLKYTWYSKGIIISHSKNLLNVADGKRYELIVTDMRGCVSKPLIVDRITTSSDSELQSQVDIFPNPLRDHFITVRFRQSYLTYKKLRIVDSRSQILREVTNIRQQNDIPLGDLPPGMYFIQFLRDDGKTFIKKFIRL